MDADAGPWYGRRAGCPSHPKLEDYLRVGQASCLSNIKGNQAVLSVSLPGIFLFFCP